MPRYFIYVIFAAPDVYIGYTRDIRRRRIAEHGNPPFWAILEVIPDDSAGSIVRDTEVKWIKDFTVLGAGILNINRDFSNGCLSLSVEARRKVGAANRGKVLSATTREKIASGQRGIPKNWSAEGIEKQKETRFKKGAPPLFTPFVKGHSLGKVAQFKPGHKNTSYVRTAEQRQKQRAVMLRLRNERGMDSRGHIRRAA